MVHRNSVTVKKSSKGNFTDLRNLNAQDQDPGSDLYLQPWYLYYISTKIFGGIFLKVGSGSALKTVDPQCWPILSGAGDPLILPILPLQCRIRDSTQ